MRTDLEPGLYWAIFFSSHKATKAKKATVIKVDRSGALWFFSKRLAWKPLGEFMDQFNLSEFVVQTKIGELLDRDKREAA